MRNFLNWSAFKRFYSSRKGTISKHVQVKKFLFIILSMHTGNSLRFIIISHCAGCRWSWPGSVLLSYMKMTLGSAIKSLTWSSPTGSKCAWCGTLCGIAWPILNHALGGRTWIFIHSMGVVRSFFGCDFISNTHRVTFYFILFIANSLLKVTYSFYENLHRDWLDSRKRLQSWARWTGRDCAWCRNANGCGERTNKV